MKRLRLHITPLLLSLAALLLAATACRDDSALTATDGPRTLTLDLGITMTRATDDGTEIGDNSRPDNLMLWIFDSTDEGANRIFYENITQGLDFALIINDQLVQTIERIINVENAPKELHFYVAMNTTDDMGLGENSTPADIEAATFQQGTWQSDNKVPMYGHAEQEISPNKSEYSFSIPLTRAVGKLELLFTKEHNDSYLKINGIKLEHIPNKGYLKENNTPTDVTYAGEEENILIEEPEISTSLSSDAELGHFSEHESNFTSLKLNYAYLLENLHGGTWAEATPDYTYPENITEKEENTRYKLTVTYQTLNDGEEKTQEIYLPAIERNVWNKIFARVKGGTLQIEYKALPWQVVSTSIGYKPQPVLPVYNETKNKWETVFDSENAYKTEHYYVLLPNKAYDNKNKESTRQLMDEIYTEPKSGDPEAVLCFVCRPGYVDNSAIENLTYLKDGSGGARFYFMLTGPEGATWEAHLTHEEDFSFSTSYEDDEFAGNADGYPAGINKATHGIARLKPYVIQIIANHNYTGTEEGQTGDEKEVEYPLITVNGKKENWGGKNYFDDTYLTEWGQQQWENKHVISTEFYITVKLTDGTEYELQINPSYTGYGGFSKEGFYYKDNRRYAGTDTRIWIRQLRAQYKSDDINNYPDLAKHVDPSERDEDEWWRDNPYWNTDND